MEILFCTISSKYRLHQCIAMYHSLKSFFPEGVLAVLAVDSESEKVLDTLKLPGMINVSAKELENDELKEIKKQRNPNEYCWTLKPVFLLYLYERFKKTRIYTYVDSDILFFSNPLQLFKRHDKCSVLLSTHKVIRKANGGFAAFMRGNIAYEALKWWKDSCLKWCYCRNDNGRFGDQGYLDSMRVKYKGVAYIDLPGANVASWNSFKYDFTIKGGNIYAGKNRLIFYHFSGLRIGKSVNSVSFYGTEVPHVVEGIYINAIKAAIGEIEEADQEITKYFYSGI